MHERLSEAIRRTGLSKAEFAERAGVDRTTLSQLLSPAAQRQPRVDTLRALAAAHELSIDWLVGLSNAGPVEAELLDHTSFEAPGPSPTDEKLLGWLGEAADYKIRYVPSTLPDLLKTDAVIRFERSRAEGPNVEQTIETTEAQLSWARHPDTEMECCSSTQALASFSRGEGMWSRLGVEARRQQLDRMIDARRRALPDVPLVPLRRFPPLRRAGDGVRAQASGALPRPALSRAHVSGARPHAEPPLRLADPRRRRATDVDGQPPGSAAQPR